MRGWDGAYAALRNAELLNDLGTKKLHFAFLCRSDRWREIPCVQYRTYRSVVRMMLLHDMLAHPGMHFPPQK